MLSFLLNLTVHAADNKMGNFENITVNGLGNLSEFRSLTIKQLKKRLSLHPNYALYIATRPIPKGWPIEIMQFSKSEHDSKIETLNSWYMNLNGHQWQYFYGFVLTTCLNEFSIIPAFIYEKNIINNAIIYKPVIAMLIDKNNEHIIRASKIWCDKAIESANQHPYYF